MNIKKSSLLIVVSIILVSCAPVTPASPASTPEAIKLQPQINDIWVNGVAVGLDESIWLLASGKVTDHDISLVNFLNGNIAVYKVSGDVSCGSDIANFSNLVADGKGALWFSTSCMIYKFDGTNWTTYSQNEIFFYPTIALDYSGNLWVGNEFGDVFRFDGKKWLSYKKNNGTQLASIESIIADPDGAVWFGGDGGIAQFDGATWTTYEKRGQYDQIIRVVDLAISSNGNIWVVADGVGDVLYLDGKKWRTVDNIPPAMMTSILVEPNGNIWVGGIHRLSYFDGKAWSEVSNLSIQAMVRTKDGTIWFGTQDGLYKFSPNQ